MYYIYVLRCKGNSLYTGITNNIEKRINAHFSRSKTAAKYTKSHQPENIEIIWKTREKANACRLEFYFKKLTKNQKEEIINGEKISKYLKGKVDCRRYKQTDYNNLSLGTGDFDKI